MGGVIVGGSVIQRVSGCILGRDRPVNALGENSACACFARNSCASRTSAEADEPCQREARRAEQHNQKLESWPRLISCEHAAGKICTRSGAPPSDFQHKQFAK